MTKYADEILRLRNMGFKYREIANYLGVNEQYAREVYRTENQISSELFKSGAEFFGWVG